MEATQSDSLVLKCHAANQRAIGEKGNVHSRESQQSVHHIRRAGTNLQKGRNVSGPKSKVVAVDTGQLGVK